MIKIFIEIDNDFLIKSLKAEGHSFFNKKGKDIVCAAVSTLVQSAYLSLLNIKTIKIELNEKNNFEFLINKIDKDVIGEIRGITIFLITGLQEIKKKYSNYLDIIIKRS